MANSTEAMRTQGGSSMEQPERESARDQPPVRKTESHGVIVEEPPLPRRTRRPLDGLRLLFAAVATTALVTLAVVAESTLTALTGDLAELNSVIPSGPVNMVSFAAGLAVQALPPVIVVILMVRGRFRTTVELLVAALLAAVVATFASEWLLNNAPERLNDSFVPGSAGSPGTPVPMLPAVLVAVVAVVARLNLKRIRQVALLAIGASFAVGLLEGQATVAGILASLSIGYIVGLLVRLISGQPSVAPNGERVAAVLKSNGYDLTSLRADSVERYRRYVAESEQGILGVLVLDRDTEGAGVLARAFDQLRTREEVRPRQAVTMRTAVNQITLQSLAVTRAGVRTPKLRKVLKVNGEATALVFDHVPGTPLSSLTGDDVSDEMLEDLWRQLRRLRRNQVAHRRLSGRSILYSETGKVWLLDPSGGEVAAPDLAIRADLAQALVAAALVVGPERAIDTASKVLSAQALSGAMPLLQVIALPRSVRREVRGKRNLLTELRDRLIHNVGREPEPVRLQRFKPLSLVTGVGAVAAVYLVGTQLVDVSFGELWQQTDLRWLIPAAAAMFLSFVGAAFAILGFVPEKVPFWRTVGAQVCLAFLRLIAPSTVGNVAVNIRLLTKAGVAAPLAAASVAANQVGNVAVTFPIIAALGFMSGSTAMAGLEPSQSTLLIIVGVLVLAALLILIPPVRNRLRSVWSDFAERGLPRLLDVLSNPRKLAVAIGGIIMQAGALVLCFYACLRAVGGSADLAALAVVQMVGNTIGMAVPTPGGLGAVEAALTAGVSTIGVAATYAVPAVLLFRIVSFWLPIVPGWVLWTQMQRRGLL
ncbi:flippase-like domain-containing protein [Phytoactinopolyspora alkaliphila]|uniref:Flippase-like domain-containing protein n=1 Tax=Phytoactinopolyspora alkaliphila TaxID=1783498 RepID=A0A6N9YQ62_9ACTN|nr:lysylphosphatidylglycerol synthase transmembrane domain-containing protein [Phytoactinopolyspora alkaliphila]NED97191.1 flippase-like domain-containing protein [Phytoactinopolyspora alkaliphila]